MLFSEPSVGVKGLRMVVVACYHLITIVLLTINFLLLTGLPEPPMMAPKRGVTRRWRRERFLERCKTRHFRVAAIHST